MLIYIYVTLFFIFVTNLNVTEISVIIGRCYKITKVLFRSLQNDNAKTFSFSSSYIITKLHPPKSLKMVNIFCHKK